MMDEMAKTLARRRAVVDKQDTPPRNDVVVGSCNNFSLNKVLILLFQDGDGDKKPWEKNNSSKFNGGGESPKPSRKRFGSASEEAGGALSVAAGKVNGTAEGSNLDLETMKQEILREMRKEMQKLKSEIVDGEC
jgi:enabled